MNEQPGSTPDGIERGEDRARRFPFWGCLASAVLVGLILYGLYRYAIRQGLAFSWSIG